MDDSRAKIDRSASSSTYAKYRQKKLKKKHKSKTPEKSPIGSNTCTCPRIKESISNILSVEYIKNKFNLLRFIVLIITFILLNVCLLYGIGSVLTLELKDFWCPVYTWNEVVEYNQIYNRSSGTPNSCYSTGRVDYDFDSLFATDISKSGLSVSKHFDSSSVLKSLLFFIFCAILVYLLFKHTCLCLIDCKKTCANEWTTKRRRSPIPIQSQLSSKNICCVETNEYWQERIPEFVWNIYLKIYEFFRQSRILDSPTSIWIIQLKQIGEIMIEIAVFYYYGGSQNNLIKWINSGQSNNLDDIVILAEKIEFVSLFAYVLSLDCILIGLLWLLYVFQHKIFRGSFFKYFVFCVDFIFDMFYAIFPIIICWNDNSDFITAAASIDSQNESFLVFIASVIPLIYIILRILTVLKLTSEYSSLQFYTSFRMKQHLNLKQSRMKTIKHKDSNHSNPKIDMNSNKPTATISRVDTVETLTLDSRMISASGTPIVHLTAGNVNRLQSPIVHVPNISVTATQSMSPITPGQLSPTITVTTNEDDDHPDIPTIGITQTPAHEHATQEHQQMNIQRVEDTDNDNANESGQRTQQPESQSSGIAHATAPSSCNFCCYGDKYLLSKNDKGYYSQLILRCRKIWIVSLGVIFIVAGLSLSISIIIHKNVSIAICDKYANNFDVINDNAKYAHLFSWDECRYKVYPINDEIPCQCRNMVITKNVTQKWYDYFDELTQHTAWMVKSALQNYYMLETFYCDAKGFSFMDSIDLTDDLMCSRNLKIVGFSSMQFNFISDNFGFNWNKLEFIEMRVVQVFLTINTKSWYQLKNLKWLTFRFSVVNVTDLNPLCEMKSLGNFFLSDYDTSYSGEDDGIHFKLPDCISKIDNLHEIGIEYFDYFDMASLLLHSKLRMVTASGNSMDSSEIERQLSIINQSHREHTHEDKSHSDSANFTWNDILNEMTNKTIYFQDSKMCDEYHADESLFKWNYPLSYAFIQASQSCKTFCQDDFAATVCRPYFIHSGVCHEYCNSKSCGYDGGDCNQMCNFDECSYKSLGDGICNPECRNKHCSWDYCDCFDFSNFSSASLEEQQQCRYNKTECDINTQCIVYDFGNNYNDTDIIIDGDSHAWVGDFWCDSYCDNDYCLYDGGDCDTCESSHCSTLWLGFEVLSSALVEDYLVSRNETCVSWFLFVSVFQEIDISNMTCHEFMDMYDKNDDNILNGNETAYAMYDVVYKDPVKASQLNCSLCWPSVDLYYYKYN